MPYDAKIVDCVVDTVGENGVPGISREGTATVTLTQGHARIFFVTFQTF